MIDAPAANTTRPGALLMALALLLFCALAWNATGLAGFAWGARGAFVVLCLIGVRSFTIREVALLGFAILATIAVWSVKGDLGAILPALDLAAFFGAFIAALTVMRDVAARSRSILKTGHFLTSQPPGRRYYSTAIGGHLMGVFLNFGAISLMAPLIQKSAVDADGTTDKALERRQLSALIRGFAWVLLWAPTTLSQAVLLTIFTEVRWADIAPLGITTAIGFIILGRLYDRFEWPTGTRSTVAEKVAPPWRAILTVSGICAVLIGSTLVGSIALGGTIAQTLMFVAPAVTLVWFMAQSPPASLQAATHRAADLMHVLEPSSAGLARSAVALGLSGYIGRMVGQALPVDYIAKVVDLSAMPGWMFLAILPVIITVGGQIALSPILLVVLLGEILQGVDALPTGQMQILFALSVGWSLSMTASPNATATLLIASSCRIAPTTLTWVWNLRYGLLSYIFAVGIFALIA